MYDVIVIGAGPSGCTAAKTLASNGYTVLLVERFKLPRYKSCSGVLIKKSLDLVKLYYEEDVPDCVTCTPAENRGMIFTDDKGKVCKFEQPGLNVWRSSFDKWLADKAVSAGAELRDGTAALSVTEDENVVSVTLKGDNKYIEQARYVIDCEGVTGYIKNKLLETKHDACMDKAGCIKNRLLETKHDACLDTAGCIKNKLLELKHNDCLDKTEGENQYITTFQTFNHGMINLDYHYFYAYLQPELSEYDAWFNVKDEQLVLGVAVKDVSKIDFYYSRFIEYMKQNYGLRIDEQIKTDKWIMPQIKPDFHIQYGVGRVLFAGEAVGFLNPMGEGISAGMESGFHVANAVRMHFGEAEKVIEEYSSSAKPLHDYMKRQWQLVGEMAGTFRFFA